MIIALTVKPTKKEVVAGSVILTEKESGKRFTYLVVDEGGSKVRLIDVEKGYLYSHEHYTQDVISHLENYWEEKVIEVFNKDEIQLTEAK